MIFDQYSRYKACADLLRQTNFAAGNSILDIGSGPECLFGQFMPDAAMNYVDPLIETDSKKGYISGNVFSSELDGRTFDCVTSIDVLEHVPSEHRQKFLQRMTLLASNTIILGFPTSDSPVAQDVDKVLEGKYREIYGIDYSWLEEHHEYGLPSLDETVAQLESMGWHCQTIGHGHAPWLKELLSFVINVWDIPALKNIVLDVSDKFNRNLYQYDYMSPCYRQFIIASRRKIPELSPPVGLRDSADAQAEFRKIIGAAKEQYFIESLQLLSKKKNLSVNEVALIEVNNELEVELDVALTERDVALTERDVALAVVNEMKVSGSWVLTRPLRFANRLFRHGLTNEDRQRISCALRTRYKRLQLPDIIKRTIRFIYYKVHGVLHSLGFFQIRFQLPAYKPLAQRPELPDYIIFGVIGWHFRHQRPQQLAEALVKTGRRVFYISPDQVDTKNKGFTVDMLDASGLLFQVNLFSKGAPAIYSTTPGPETIKQLSADFIKLFQWADIDKTIMLVQHPYWYSLVSNLPNKRIVYDCMDHHEGFINTADSLLDLEKKLFQNADLTVVTSDWLDQTVSQYGKQSVIIRNAADYDHFSVVPQRFYHDERSRKVIGYFGAIADWFDVELVEKVAKHFSDCSILLVGEDTVDAQTRLEKLDNVTFMGEVAYAKLPYYLFGFDVCLLPFKIIPLTMATNPVKAYEYLSAGKPVVSVDLPEMSQFNELVYVASDQTKFIELIDDVLSEAEPISLVRKRQNFAANQTWGHRVSKLIKNIEGVEKEPTVSIVVVTFNNLEFTKACLYSLDRHSLYENKEIIVVDNASSDDTQGYLQEWENAGENRKILLNEKNLGFAAANNQGLEIAKGDYLVLLNNDTYVTPGWLSILIGHLKKDKSIGLIGPVTNNIGNEARIEIRYDDMSEMIVRSTAYTRNHIGQIYPLRTAAFFCVMIERKTFEQVGLLDEKFGKGFFEDDDYCRRIEEIGLRIVCAEDVFIHHHLSASFNKLNDDVRQELFDRNKAIYEEKWGDWVPHSHER